MPSVRVYLACDMNTLFGVLRLRLQVQLEYNYIPAQPTLNRRPKETQNSPATEKNEEVFSGGNQMPNHAGANQSRQEGIQV